MTQLRTLFQPVFRGWHTTLVLAAVLGFSGSFSALAADPNIENGRQIAQQWCASCHAVAPGGPARDVAPAFHNLANDPKYTEDRLRTWLMNPHPPMPPLEISNTQIDALVAYIRAQRGSAN